MKIYDMLDRRPRLSKLHSLGRPCYNFDVRCWTFDVRCSIHFPTKVHNFPIDPPYPFHYNRLDYLEKMGSKPFL
jgi:hypothetical protein